MLGTPIKDNQQRSNQIVTPLLEDVYMKKLIKNDKYQFRVNYYADDNGHIWSENKQDYMTEYDDKNGYKKVLLMTTDKPTGKGHRFSVHRLILSTFNPVDNMNELTVDHIDGNYQNNCLTNLRWTTMRENLNNPNTKINRRCYDQDGTHNTSAVFDIQTLMLLIEDVNSGHYKRKEVLDKYQICDETLRRILLKQTYQSELKDVIISPNFISDYARDTAGAKNGMSKLTEDEVLEIIDLLLSKQYTYKQIALKFNVSPQIIGRIKRKETWTYLTKDITFD